MKKGNFYDKVFAVARQIPYGRISSYGAIVRFLGAPGSARMVGYAMNGSSVTESDVPAHRVVNRQGLLTGKHHFGGSTMMEDLLRSEGVEVVDDKVQNFKELFWDPLEYLNRKDFIK